MSTVFKLISLKKILAEMETLNTLAHIYLCTLAQMLANHWGVIACLRIPLILALHYIGGNAGANHFFWTSLVFSASKKNTAFFSQS